MQLNFYFWIADADFLQGVGASQHTTNMLDHHRDSGLLKHITPQLHLELCFFQIIYL